MSFASLGLSEALVRAVEAAGYTTPTPVQLRAIPAALQGRDLMVAAQTGTGKTGGFALPILERLFPNGHPDREHRHGPRQPRVLVLTPTRELAAQVHDSFKQYARDLPLVSTVIFGGVGMNPQIQAMAKGVDVLVACPGRLLDLINQKVIDLSHVETLVLDEADRMLDMGFIHDVKKVLAKLPAQRQNLLFSATFSGEISELASKLLHNPERIEVTPPNTTVERIEQRVYRLPASHKRALLAHLITAGAWEQVLVFTRTKHGANRLAEYLDKHGLPAVAIHGNKSQNARTKALADFKAGQVRILVATDIAARGLDIDQLPHVVNFELPNVEEDYVHRIGRTGRAGRSGEAISLVAPDEEKLLKGIERMTRQRIADGDTMGFDPSTVEVEKPEVRGPRPERQPRADRPQRERSKPAASSTESKDGRSRNSRNNGRGQSRGPAEARATAPSAPVVPPPNRDPEAFLDDEFDNFGNRADYVSPNPPKAPGRNPRRTGAAPAQGRPQGDRPRPQGASAAGKPKRNGPARSNGGGRRDDSRQDPLRSGRQEPAVQDARSVKQPLIIRKGERLPTLEQLSELESRNDRRERPALLSSRPSED
ncbi:DEAD/DEAH box helicase [Pseudomonas sp. N040]|uniref:DEAD/DEAH box helicase n=1 Tax=Pseudomonas sp. N040 TaxID=2785325 RepID=UPI0018A32A09|nr:DEAD/DEAH box helicase [Pseudomonas sp. N040]MBF7728558.1 DEAD/DEAH box helicase [Pseudomonas sp. N040]MBW7012198.1 DEAD/DEAH box helicase [Pseudomonas sp. N040]